MNNSVNDNDIRQFIENLNDFNISLNEKQINQFVLYYNMLIEWNSYINLTTITDFSEVLLKHFIDSLSLIKAVPDLSKRNYWIIDVGTGAGFPGIPLKIVFSNLNIILLDSLNKRINYLNEVIKNLKLDNIDTIHGRAEDFSKKNELREKFDICVSRAVANMSVLSEYCIPFVKVNGYFIPYKSDKVEEELRYSEKAIDILGGKIDNQIEFYLPNSNIYRNLVVIKKNTSTPTKYPRKAGIPSKEPL